MTDSKSCTQEHHQRVSSKQKEVVWLGLTAVEVVNAFILSPWEPKAVRALSLRPARAI